ncbi:MAG: hypothetical protein KBH45_06530 [Verrucomicrobia bacterium]|nr:hypothetical protein [Verrucomicrobiota bacterium]
MTSPIPPRSASRRLKLPRAGWSGLFLLAIVLAATTNGSFWIDECVTADVARHPSLMGAWRAMVQLKFAEVQLPFYIGYIWAFEKLFGHSELALRLAALPFFVGGMTLLAGAFARRTGRVWPLLVAVGLSPFAWYYLNEARLYAMQMGVTAMIVAALIQLNLPPAAPERTESRWLTLYLLGVILLSGISMLGQMWAGAALLAVFVVVPKTRWATWWDRHRGKLLLTAGALLLLGGYYLWSLTIGARATAVGATNLQTILFIFYEQLGCVGPGPGRIELRAAGVAALKPFAVGLGTYATVVGLVLVAGLVALWQNGSRRLTLGALACLALPAGLILLAGVATHFRVLGRHFAPLAVILFVILGLGLLHLWQRRGCVGRGLATGFVVVTLASCLLIRFAPRHAKDDCRQAAQLAKAALAQNEIVWWNAGDMAATYYDVPIANSGSNQTGVLVVFDPQPAFAIKQPKPGTVITSKPDIYDSQGVLAGYLKENGYQPITNLMAFTLWKRK